MSGMDGFDAIRKIRKHCGNSTKILALWSSEFEADRQKALEFGADGFLRKSFQIEELLKLRGVLGGVRYRYKERQETRFTPENLTEFLDWVPSDLASHICEAALRADRKEVLTLLDLIPNEFAGVGSWFKSMVDVYNYDGVLEHFQARPGLQPAAF
jgi:CheY-like chemotaxis protein